MPTKKNGRKREPQAVAAAIETLRSRYELGKSILAEYDAQNGPYSRGVMAKMAEELGEKRSALEKFRVFARDFTVEDLNELCELRTDEGKPISWGHVTKLLQVRDKRKRNAFARKAAKQGWTARSLELEIRKKQPRKRLASPPWKLARDNDGALMQIKLLADKFESLCRQLERQSEQGEFGVTDLPDDVQVCLKQAARSLARLKDACDAE